MRYNIEEIEMHLDFRAKINSVSVGDINLFMNGKQIKVCPKVEEQFEFTGLNTLDFIATGYYLKECECGNCKAEVMGNDR